MPRSEIIIKNCQIKGAKAFKEAARGIDIIEEYTGIRETKITLENVFVCPFLNLDKFGETDIERALVKIITKLRER